MVAVSRATSVPNFAATVTILSVQSISHVVTAPTIRVSAPTKAILKPSFSRMSSWFCRMSQMRIKIKTLISRNSKMNRRRCSSAWWFSLNLASLPLLGTLLLDTGQSSAQAENRSGWRCIRQSGEDRQRETTLVSSPEADRVTSRRVPQLAIAHINRPGRSRFVRLHPALRLCRWQTT